MANIMVWAVTSADNSARHISEVKAGLNCECVCPGCRAPLEAVNSENPTWKRRPHFRHEKLAELESCSEASILAAAKDCLANATEICLPGYFATVFAKTDNGKLLRETVEGRSEIVNVTAYEFVDVTDAILTLESGQQVYVRLIASSHSYQQAQPKHQGMAEISIDISDPKLLMVDRDVLRKFISLSVEHRKWCRNQIFDSLKAQAQMKVDKAAEEHAAKAHWQLASEPRRDEFSRKSICIWRASWPSHTELVSKTQALLDTSPHREILVPALFALPKSPSESPIHFADRLAKHGVPNDYALDCLAELGLIIRK
ncbi:hypothetical protein ACO0LG_04575 [Undibacterium sp. Ji42W]|uniref:hypothetical protein n=1 Tax=Undibacterium sp. Ji42W TaxID=3413039 RepID=UPI003BF3CE5B